MESLEAKRRQNILKEEGTSTFLKLLDRIAKSVAEKAKAKRGQRIKARIRENKTQKSNPHHIRQFGPGVNDFKQIGGRTREVS